MMLRHDTGAARSRRKDRWVRWAAVCLTVAALALELYVWAAWKVSRDVLRAFQEAVRDSTPAGPR